MLQMMLQALLAIAVPAIATWALMQATKLTAWGNALPDWEKRVVVVLYGVLIAGIGHALGLQLPQAWGALSGTDVQAIFSAGVAFLLHRLFHPVPA